MEAPTQTWDHLTLLAQSRSFMPKNVTDLLTLKNILIPLLFFSVIFQVIYEAFCCLTLKTNFPF